MPIGQSKTMWQCKLHNLVANFANNANGATWRPNFEPIQVVPMFSKELTELGLCLLLVVEVHCIWQLLKLDIVCRFFCSFFHDLQAPCISDKCKTHDSRKSWIFISELSSVNSANWDGVPSCCNLNWCLPLADQSKIISSLLLYFHYVNTCATLSTYGQHLASLKLLLQSLRWETCRLAVGSCRGGCFCRDTHRLNMVNLTICFCRHTHRLRKFFSLWY